MVTVAVLLLVVAVVAAVWRRRARQGGAAAPGALASLVDQARDLIAPLYPSQPLSRRALPRRLLRAAEQTVTVGVSGMVLVPTRIRIAVNPADLEPFTDAMEWLRHDVAEALRQKATANGWIVPDGPHVEIVPDEQRPVRLPRAVGRIDAFRPDDVRTRRRTVPPTPSPEPEPDQPDQTPMTSIAVAPGDAGYDPDLPTAPASVSIHVRLVSLTPSPDGGHGDLNALLLGTGAPLVIGRSREADLPVRDRQASGRHCALSVDPEERSVVVRDLRSTNGTYVDGQRVDEATLASGATLQVGGASWRVELNRVSAVES